VTPGEADNDDDNDDNDDGQSKPVVSAMLRRRHNKIKDSFNTYHDQGTHTPNMEQMLKHVKCIVTYMSFFHFPNFIH